MSRELEVAAVPAFYQKYEGEVEREFEYDWDPYQDIETLDEARWTPQHLREAYRREMDWAQAMCWAERLQSVAGGHNPENRTENKQVQGIIEISLWAQRWAYEGFGIRRRRTGDQKDDLRP